MTRHLGHERFDVIAHQIEFMYVIPLTRMHRYFSRRQSEDQPSLAYIYMREL